MCRHSYYSRGYRSFGANIPGYAQGACFPGDEPGEYCNISRKQCYLEYDDAPELCEIQDEAGSKCPDCEAGMLRNGNEVVYCPDCGYRE